MAWTFSRSETLTDVVLGNVANSEWQHVRRSSVYFAPMPDSHDAYRGGGIVYLVYHAVVTDANTPVILRSGDLAAAWWTRILGERSYVGDNAAEGISGQLLQVSLSCRLVRISCIGAAFLQEIIQSLELHGLPA